MSFFGNVLWLFVFFKSKWEKILAAEKKNNFGKKIFQNSDLKKKKQQCLPLRKRMQLICKTYKLCNT